MTEPLNIDTEELSYRPETTPSLPPTSIAPASTFSAAMGANLAAIEESISTQSAVFNANNTQFAEHVETAKGMYNATEADNTAKMNAAGADILGDGKEHRHGAQAVDYKQDKGDDPTDPSTQDSSGYTASQFQQDGVEEGGTPGFDAAHNAQGIRSDEGVIINGNRILFGDTLGMDGKGGLTPLGTPMYHYHLDETGKPILDGPPINTGGPLEQGIPDGTRIIATGGTGADGMPNGTNLMFGKAWGAGDGVHEANFGPDTMVFDTSGNGPFANVATIHGLRDMTVTPYGNNQLLVSGVEGGGANPATRGMWITPPQTHPGDFSFLDKDHWTQVGSGIPVNSNLNAESAAHLFHIDTPSGPQYALISPTADNSGLDMRMSSTPQGVMDAAPTHIVTPDTRAGTYLYSPNVTQITALPDGSYNVGMTFSERWNPQPDPSKPGFVPLGDLGHQTYQNAFGHVRVAPAQ